mgnify:FL=1
MPSVPLDTEVEVVESSTEGDDEVVEKKKVLVVEGPSTETATIEESETVDQVAATHKGSHLPTCHDYSTVSRTI